MSLYLSTLGAALLSAAPEAALYPIRPVPLSELVASSDLIALVRPGSAREVEGESGFWMKHVELRVERFLKGREVGPIDTRFSAHVLCPAPPSYPEGERVLAFLRRDEDGAFWTVGLSYGTKRLEDTELELYEARIAELLQLQADVPEEWREMPEFVEWLVRCAADPATRWEGAWELDPRGDWHSESVHGPAVGCSDRLDAAQRAVLLNALFASPSIDSAELCLAYALDTLEDARLEAFLLDRLGDDDPDGMSAVPDVMRFLAQRWNDRRARRFAEDYEDGWLDELPADELRACVESFLSYAATR